MKATDFNLKDGIQFHPEKGMVVNQDTRLVIMDSNAMGLLLDAMIRKLGFREAMQVFSQSGFEHGYSDFIAMKAMFGDKFDSEIELFASGPVIHSWEGLVNARPTKIEIDRKTGHFICEGVWTNSWQAQQYLTFNRIGEKAVCSSLTGYASGWSTGFFGQPILCIEPSCVAKGDEHCGWLLKPLKEFGKEGADELSALKEQFEKFEKTR